MTIRRGEVWIVDLDPTQGDEMRKTRPCLVVSIDSLDTLRLKVREGEPQRPKWAKQNICSGLLPA